MGESEELREQLNELEDRVERLESLVEEEPSRLEDTRDMRTFVRDFDPDTHTERALAIGYYLEEYEGVEAFSTGDIEDGYRRCRLNTPANMSDVLGSCVEREWMHDYGKDGQVRLRRLTNEGLEHVMEVM